MNSHNAHKKTHKMTSYYSKLRKANSQMQEPLHFMSVCKYFIYYNIVLNQEFGDQNGIIF